VSGQTIRIEIANNNPKDVQSTLVIQQLTALEIDP
jgi:hypothetical protein